MIEEIDLDKLQGLLDNGAVLVDVREEEEIRDGAIKGMTPMPLSRFDEFKDQISKDKPTVFYCRSGRRSMTAAKLAEQWTDQNLYSLVGGYLGYTGQL